MRRYFVAVDLPDYIKGELFPICVGLPNATWVDSGQFHLTIRYIGEVNGGRELDISEALASVQASPFELTLQGVGYFPPRSKDPQQIWLGALKSEPLTVFRGRVEAALARNGFPRETRKYFPHVTLARLHHTPIERVMGFLVQHSLIRFEPFQVSDFYLYSSQTTSQGVVYEQEERFQLSNRLVSQVGT